MSVIKPSTEVVPLTRENPYVGPRSFRPGEHLHGRDREIADLRDTLIAERIALFYSPSGAGKSSLLESGLRPELDEQGFRVLPTIRVGHESAVGSANRYVLSVLMSLEESDAVGGTRLSTDKLASHGLAEYLDGVAASDPDGGELCLFFDQFEEVFTVDVVDRDVKEAFFEQLGDLLRDREIWAIFAMREDYIAQLDPYLRLIPRRLSTRVRLDFLDTIAAEAAIRRPAATTGVAFTDDGLARLVDDLRTVRSEHGGETQLELGVYVEPVQLQVVCRQLWSRLPDDDHEVSVADIEAYADTNHALGQFYADQIEVVAAETGVTERSIRDWFESALITRQGFRAQVSEFPGADGPEVLRELENAYLIRADRRRGVNWYELTHDRMIGPVVESNAAWRDAQLVSFQRLAIEWQAAHEPDSMLVSAEAFDEARAWAAEHGAQLSEVDREFLARSERLETQRLVDSDRQRREIERARHQRRILTTALVVVLAALVMSIVAFRRAANARQAAQASLLRSEAGDLGARAQLAKNPYVGLLLAIEAEYRTPTPGVAGRTAWVAESARVARQLTDPVAVMTTGTGETMSVSWSASGDKFVAANADGTATVYGRDGQSIGEPFEVNRNAGTWSAAFSPDGSMLAVADSEQYVHLFDAAGRRRGEPILIGGGDSVRVFAWAPDSTRFVAGTGSFAAIYDADGRQLTDQLTTPQGNNLRAIAWSPDGQKFLIGDNDGKLTLFDDQGALVQADFADYKESSWSIAWRSDSEQVVAGFDDGVAHIYDVNGTLVGEPLVTGGDAAYAVSWSPDDEYMMSVNGDGQVLLYHGDGTRAGVPLVWTDEDAGRSIAWDPNASRVVVGYDDGSARIFALAPPGGYPPLAKLEQGIAAVAWSSLGTLAVGTESSENAAGDEIPGRVVLYSAAGEPVGEPFELDEGSVSDLAFTRDGNRLAVGNEDGGAVILDASAVALTEPFQPGEVGVIAVAWSPDGSQLAIGDYEGAVGIFDADGESVGTEFTAGVVGQPVNSVGWSPDGTRIVVGTDNSMAQFFDPRGTPMGTSFRTGGDHTGAVSWDPQGEFVAIANEDHTFGIYRPDGTSLVSDIKGGSVADLAWSPDGRLIALIGDDGTLRLATADGALLGDRFPIGSQESASVAWSPTDSRLVIGNAGGTVQLIHPWSEVEACLLLRRTFTVEAMERTAGGRSKCAHDELAEALPAHPTMIRTAP